MKKHSSTWSLLNTLVILPFNALVIIPILLLSFSSHTAFWNPIALQLPIAIMFLVLGFYLAFHTSYLFFVVGRGTPAPWDPPKKLITVGPYKYSRNPMLTGALLMLLGEVLIFSSFMLLMWFIVFFVANNLYFTYYEEPGLEKRFGKDYKNYKKKVRRWI